MATKKVVQKTKKEKEVKVATKTKATTKATKVQEVAKRSSEDYKNLIMLKKWEVHNAGGNELELDATSLMKELNETSNTKVVTKVMEDLLLEGDKILASSVGKKDFKVLYYCDNLSPERRRLLDIL